MTHRIEWKPSARKEVRKLDPPIRRRIVAAVEQFMRDVYRHL